MPDFRIHQSIADRADVGFNRRPNLLRRWRSRVTWCSFIVALLIVVALFIYDDKSVYWSGSTAAGHRLFQKDCAKCHDQSLAPLARLANFDNSIHSVTVAACTTCHKDITVDDHSPRIATHDLHAIENCAACHREHAGHESLSWVSDQHCVQCHGDLDVQAKGDVPNVVRQIVSLADHPEFAVKRSDPMPQPSASHAVWDVAEKENGKWTDRAKIRFNHWKHLDPEGLPLPPQPGESADPIERKKLSCTDCHVPDSRGQYMQPIRYEQHCKQCHRLEYSTRLAVGDDGSLQPLPHVAPELIRGILRDRLMAFAKANPQTVLEQTKVQQGQSDEPRHPNKRRNRGPTAHDEWTWTEKMLAAMEAGIRRNNKLDDAQQVAEMAAGKIISQVSYGCQHCHYIAEPEVDEANAATLVDWRIVPPNIPNRWLLYSRFNHNRHTQIACTGCHDPQRVNNPRDVLPAAGSESRLSSKSATDILMPPITICLRCHTKTDEPNLATPLNSATQGQARDNCVECHDYHH